MSLVFPSVTHNERWTFTVDLVSGDGSPFDLTEYDLDLDFRPTPEGRRVAGVKARDGDNLAGSVVIEKDPSVVGRVTILSAPGARGGWMPHAPIAVTGDLMGTLDDDGPYRLERISFTIYPSFTHV